MISAGDNRSVMAAVRSVLALRTSIQMCPRLDTSWQKDSASSCFSSSDMLPKRVASMAICSARPLPASSAARCSLLCVEPFSPVANRPSSSSLKVTP
eukprot:scaffold22608_cov66-Phaeocystis_antarctica.AAC.3